ncbi:hypothetical protein LUZ61_015504 [Rhynchospora tenuis]|uniref:Uncharacterized protein n=1 Tax=Rhynchospora tenuis TaxID=198213 RepID=A0AAD6EIK9_9POAL|nr:hypothetical protein LUZ61_015504 [Rhynchospora tenuis]
MEDFRSSSYTDRTREIDSYNSHDLRCYSASYASTRAPNKEFKLNKGKSANGSSSFRSVWSLSDPELQRKKRVMGYRVYDVEGKMKGSLSPFEGALNGLKRSAIELYMAGCNQGIII